MKVGHDFRQHGFQYGNELAVDNFAGGGGASTGIEQALGRSVDIAINHSPVAIAMHEANHPHTKHFQEDVFKVDPVKVCAGRPVGIAWFSPDCKHFSKAKGGKPVEKKIRGLAWVVIKWAKAVRPRLICLENVEEFEDWGPLTLDGYPHPDKLGLTFRRWRKALENEGYNVETRVMRCCDFGGHTIRKRLYLVARCDGLPIVWREPTHGKGRKKYHTAAEILDFSLPCPSVFLTKEEGKALGVRRPLAEATMARIARGTYKHVLNNPKPFIVPLTHQGAHRSSSIDEPLPTLTGAHRGELAVVTPFITEHANASAQRNIPVDEPMRTLCGQVKGGHFAIVAPTMIQTGYGEREGQHPRSLDLHKPMGTIVGTGGKHAVVAHFLAQHNAGWNESAGRDLRQPLSTLMGSGSHQSLISSHLLKLKGTNRTGASVTEPVPTIQAEGNHIGEVRAFLTKYHGMGGNTLSVEDPLSTITAKDRLGLVYVYGSLYQLADIGMRMLTPREAFAANDFPPTYTIDPWITIKNKRGKTITRRLSKTEQMQMCGNAVDPIMATMLIEDNYWQESKQEVRA